MQLESIDKKIFDFDAALLLSGQSYLHVGSQLAAAQHLRGHVGEHLTQGITSATCSSFVALLREACEGERLRSCGQFSPCLRVLTWCSPSSSPRRLQPSFSSCALRHQRRLLNSGELASSPLCNSCTFCNGSQNCNIDGKLADAPDTI